MINSGLPAGNVFTLFFFFLRVSRETFLFFGAVTGGFDCKMNAHRNEKGRAKHFLTTPSAPKKKKKQKKRGKYRGEPAVCIYIYTALTTMNKTAASQPLLGHLIATFSSRPYINIVSLNNNVCQWIGIIASGFFLLSFIM